MLLFGIPLSINVQLQYEPHHEKTGFCIYENKDADQLPSNCASEQRLCYTPGIYAEGYIVFVFPFVSSYVLSFVCSFVRSYNIPSRGICVKVLR